MNAGGETEESLSLTVVMPVYKEHRRLIAAVDSLIAFMERTEDVSVDVIFVDDGSPDDTADILNAYLVDRDDPRMRLLRYAVNRGKGYAVKTGVRAARGDLILMSDADLSTPLEDWRVLYAALQEGADIACGSRAVRGAHIGKPPPLFRRLLSRVFNLLVRAAGVHGIRDTQCGFKLFKAEAARAVFGQLRTDRFAFDVEVIACARDLGYRVAEVPVNWDYSGHSTVRVFSSGGRMVWDLFVLALRRAIIGKAARAG
jgi:dolichyl-phosphate beta-glucosyltransferase